MTDIDRASRKLKRQPVQLALFDALGELDQRLDAVKKSVAKVELEIERSRSKPA